MDDPPAPLQVLPPWAAEFYHHKAAIISLFERHASEGGFERFKTRTVVQDFVESFNARKVRDFVHRQPAYWRKFTDYLRWFNEVEREQLWTIPIRKFINDLQSEEHGVEINEKLQKPPSDMIATYRAILARLSGQRGNKNPLLNQIDALSAACIHYLNVQRRSQEEYHLVLTGSRFPLRVFREFPYMRENEKIPMAVSPISMACLTRFRDVYRHSAYEAYSSFLDFVKDGLCLFLKTRNVDLPSGTSGFISKQQGERMRYVQTYESQLAWVLDCPSASDESIEDKALRVHGFIADKRRFKDEMGKVVAFLSPQKIVLENAAAQKRLDTMVRQYS